MNASLKHGFLTAKEAGFPLGSFGADGIRVTDHKFWASMTIRGVRYDYVDWIRGDLPTGKALDDLIQLAVKRIKEKAARCAK